VLCKGISLLKYAIYTPTNQLSHVDDVPNGRLCGCVCSGCDDTLIAHNKGENQTHHFKHTNPEREGKTCLMTQLHLWAQQYISKLDSITFSAPKIVYEGKTIETTPVCVNITKAHLEKRVGIYWADVYLETPEEHIAIEVKVSHACTQEKINYYKDQKVPSVELDLSTLVGVEIEEVKRRIDTQDIPCVWYYPARRESFIRAHLDKMEKRRVRDKEKVSKAVYSLFESLKSGDPISLPKLERILQLDRYMGVSRMQVTLIEKQDVSLKCVQMIYESDGLFHFIGYLKSRPLHFIARCHDNITWPKINHLQSSLRYDLRSSRWVWHRNARELRLAKKQKWRGTDKGVLTIKELEN